MSKQKTIKNHKTVYDVNMIKVEKISEKDSFISGSGESGDQRKRKDLKNVDKLDLENTNLMVEMTPSKKGEPLSKLGSSIALGNIQNNQNSVELHEDSSVDHVKSMILNRSSDGENRGSSELRMPKDVTLE